MAGVVPLIAKIKRQFHGLGNMIYNGTKVVVTSLVGHNEKKPLAR
jgi:hypothetical protein